MLLQQQAKTEYPASCFEDLHITEAHRQHAVGMLMEFIPVFLNLTCTTQRWGEHKVGFTNNSKAAFKMTR